MTTPADPALEEAIDEVIDWLESEELALDHPVRAAIKKLNHARIMALSHPPAAAEPTAVQGEAHDNLRDRIGQAISDVLTSWYGTEDGTLGVDPFDSRNIDEIADAVIDALPAPSPQPTQQAAPAVQATQEDLRRLVFYAMGYSEDDDGDEPDLEYAERMLTEQADALITKALGAKGKP